MNLIVHPPFTHGFQRVFQSSASVLGGDNNAISAIQSKRGCSFEQARRIYEAEQAPGIDYDDELREAAQLKYGD